MKIDVRKLDLLLARRCMMDKDLKNTTSAQTVKRIRRGDNIRPATAGRVAIALGVDVCEIVVEEAR